MSRRIISIVKFGVICAILTFALVLLIFIIGSRLIGEGSHKVGDGLLLIFVGFWISLILSVPLTIGVLRKLDKKIR